MLQIYEKGIKQVVGFILLLSQLDFVSDDERTELLRAIGPERATRALWTLYYEKAKKEQGQT